MRPLRGLVLLLLLGPCGCTRAGFETARSDDGAAARDRLADQPHDRRDLRSEARPDLGPAAGALLWARRYGDGSAQQASHLAVDRQGNLYVAGQLDGQADFGGAPLISAGADVFLVSLTSGGAHRWSLRFGDALMQQVSGLAVDAQGNLYLGGAFRGSFSLGTATLSSPTEFATFVASFTADGAVRWVKQIGPGWRVSVAAAPTGGIVIAASATGSTTLGSSSICGAGDSDVLVARISSAGVPSGARCFGDSAGQDVNALAVDVNDHVLVGGRFFGTLDFGVTPLVCPYPLPSRADGFLASFDPQGAALWARRLGGDLLDSVVSVAVDAAGVVYATGFFQISVDLGGGVLEAKGAIDSFVAAYSSSGLHLWSRTLSGRTGLELLVEGSDLLFAGGFSEGADLGGAPVTSAGGTDLVYGAFTLGGAHRWSRRGGDASMQAAADLATDGSGLYLVGYLEGTLDLGPPAPLTSAGGADAFVAKVSF